MGRDLGTFYVRVVFEDGHGFIMEWGTSGRWTRGRDSFSPLDADWITPTYENADDVVDGIRFMFTQGNYSCDCNRRDFLAQAHQEECLPDEMNPCGDTIVLRSLEVLAPNASNWEEVTLREKGSGDAED